jgi:hypothetical protein
MPQHIKFIARYGNGALAVLLFVFALFGGEIGFALACVPFFALAVFNIYVIEKAARLMSEEAWLEAEIRKVELRHKLAALQAADAHDNPPAVVMGDHPAGDAG